jgi:hypothetical protein
MSKKNELEDRHAAQPKDLDAYEPPQVTVLGSITELTSGAGGTFGKDFDTSSGPC